MNLPNLSEMDVSNFVKDIAEWRMAALVAGPIGLGIVCQTIIDIFQKKPG